MDNWSKLPFDLLNEVVMRFETFEDLIYFSVVCRSWNHFASMVKHKFNEKTMPWLLLAENPENTENNNRDGLRKVFNPYNNKYYQLKLPEMSGCRCWGSAYGWLVTYNPYLDLHMFNLLTKVRKPLPPITSLPYRWGRYFPHPYDCTLQRMRTNFIYKAFVIKVGADDFIVFVSYYFGWKMLAFARPGDQSWTSIVQRGHRTGASLSGSIDCAIDVVHFGTQILILNEDASLGFLNIGDLSDPQKLIVKYFAPVRPMFLSDQRNLGIQVMDYLPPPLIDDGFDTKLYGLYLVHSCGDIFMVLRDRWFLTDDDIVYKTIRFVVLRLDFEGKKWCQVNDLGDVAFFVGNCSSMSVPTTGNCKSNCIYYNDDYDDGWNKPKTLGGKDTGFFTLKDGKLDQIPEECYSYSKRQTPLWFMPQL